MERASDLVLVFETHATSLDNEAGLASGWFDVDLSPRGEDQACALGSRRRHDDFVAVFCSDLSRARRTAEIAFNDRQLPIVPDARLRECDYGTLTRRPALEIEARRADYIVTPFPEGESYQQVVERVSSWLTDAICKFAGETVLVIGHRATFYAFEHVVRKLPLHEAVVAPWQWQPGWVYHITRNSDGLQRSVKPAS